MPIARQRVAKHIPAEGNARNNRTSIARQRRGKHAFATIEEVVFYSYMGPSRDYISSPVVNQKSVSRRTRKRMERVLRSQGRRVRLKIDCDLL
jgi:hypothetical protein